MKNPPRWSWLGRVAAIALLLPLLAAAADLIPVDPAVRVGKLPNGLTYYIRHNAKPEKRVELRLAVNAGSVQEDEDQRGLAHFVEHMCFRGTKSFPKNELIHYLQSIGSSFGPDINAYTAWDQTVYMLTVPSDKEDIVQNGVRIMSEWAHAVNFDLADIDTERHVVVEEWRLGRGASQRMLDKFLPQIFSGSRYAERLPIGQKEIIEGASYDTVKRFYHDWYRPDLMAFVVVGDVDPDKMEAQIRAEFGAIPKPESPRPRPSFTIGDNDAPIYSIVSDRENPYNVVFLAFKTEAPHYQSLTDYHRLLTERLHVQLFNLRVAELMQQANPPFLYANSSYGHLWVRAKGGYQMVVVVPDGGVDRGLQAVLTESERVRQHGFTAAELERAKKSLLSSLEQAYADREKTESNRLVDGYVEHFLSDEPVPGIAFEYTYTRDHLADISLKEVNALAAEWITPKNRLVVFESVEKPAVKIPPQTELQAVVQQVTTTAVSAYQEKSLPTTLLATAPTPGKVAACRKVDPVGVTELTLSNGVHVVLKPSDFKNDEILFSAQRPGGQSVYPLDCKWAAMLASDYAQESGVANFSQPDLQKMLAGKVVSVRPQLSLYYDGLKGSCAVKDFETALQLTYLYFTALRVDETAYQSVVARQKAMLQNILSDPTNAFFEDAEKTEYAQHRWVGLPTDEDWKNLSLAKIADTYRGRFGDARGFTFTFVGSFDEAKIIPLLEKYLGSLPSTGAATGWKDLGIRPVAGPLEHRFERGTDPKSFVLIAVESQPKFSRDERHLLWSFGNILQRALIDKLRLELGGVYYAGVNTTLDRVPYEHAGINIVIPCAPTNVDKLVVATYGEIARLQKDGVKPEELQKEIESQRRAAEKDAKDNGAWLMKLDMIQRFGETYGRLENPSELVALVTPENLKRVANQYADTSKALRFTLYPVSAATSAPAAAPSK